MRKFLWLPSTILLLCCIVGVTSCSLDDDPTPVPQPDVPLIILDTDIGSSTDDLFALQLAYRYQDKGLCRILGVVIDREGEELAALPQAIVRSARQQCEHRQHRIRYMSGTVIRISSRQLLTT